MSAARPSEGERADPVRCVRASGTFVGHARRRLNKVELASIPMTEPHEFASVLQFEQPQPAPVRVSPSERYAILTALLRELRAAMPEPGFIGVRLYGSDFDVQLSAEMLAADVLVTHAPLQLLPTLLQAGRRDLVVFHHDLRADGLEQGRNEFAAWLVAPTPAGLDGFSDFVGRSGFLQGLRGLAVERAGAEALEAAAARPDLVRAPFGAGAGA
ncbi:MAG: hypothetical protein ABW032_07725 [Burkholderiaceae bacterium]